MAVTWLLKTLSPLFLSCHSWIFEICAELWAEANKNCLSVSSVRLDGLAEGTTCRLENPVRIRQRWKNKANWKRQTILSVYCIWSKPFRVVSSFISPQNILMRLKCFLKVTDQAITCLSQRNPLSIVMGTAKESDGLAGLFSHLICFLFLIHTESKRPKTRYEIVFKVKARTLLHLN